ncbi:hypothetical protein, partial [Paenibacillus sonchi]|uniref:hypothetical protein n=1 Tax=Paenibacillus sonchi TaxID=373687 RepID=UPI001ADEDFAE
TRQSSTAYHHIISFLPHLHDHPPFHPITVNFNRIWRGGISTNLADLMYKTGRSGWMPQDSV